MSNNVSGDITEGTKIDKARRRLIAIWTWVGAILLAVAAAYVAGMLAIAVGIIIWSAVFVFLLRGPVNWLDSHGVNRTLGTALAYVLLVAIIGFLIFIIFSPVFGIRDQFVDLMNNLPVYVEAFQTWAGGVYEQYADILQSEAAHETLTNALMSFSDWLKSFATNSATGVIAAGASIANIVMCIGFALVIAFWMLIELPNLGREANRLIGEKYREDAQMLHLTVTRVMGGYLKATIIQCAIIGVACGIMFAILGVPSPAAFGVITGLLNIIPIVGPWLGGALALIVSIPTSAVTGIIALIGTIVLQQIVYTFVSPKLMSDSVDIHPALTFIALMAGSGIGTAMGGLVGALVGALLSIPLTAMAKAIFVYYFEKRTGRRIVAPDGVFFKGVVHESGAFDPMVDATAPQPVPAPTMTGSFPFVNDLSERLPKIEDDQDDRPARKQ